MCQPACACGSKAWQGVGASGRPHPAPSACACGVGLATEEEKEEAEGVQGQGHRCTGGTPAKSKDGDNTPRTLFAEQGIHLAKFDFSGPATTKDIIPLKVTVALGKQHQPRAHARVHACGFACVRVCVCACVFVLFVFVCA